jgi:hypothetical protein
MTAPTSHQLPPLEDVKRQYVELDGSSLVLNTYLKIALVCVSLIALGRHEWAAIECPARPSS